MKSSCDLAEFVRVLVGEEDEVAGGAEVVALCVFGGCGFSFRGDWAVGFGAVRSGCFVLFVATHDEWFYLSISTVAFACMFRLISA